MGNLLKRNDKILKDRLFHALMSEKRCQYSQNLLK